MFEKMVKSWFAAKKSDYNRFIMAMLQDDVEAMNDYMNEIAEHLFSSFDTGEKPSKKAPERFYHGFVLGLMVDLQDRYIIKSNRESGLDKLQWMIMIKL